MMSGNSQQEELMSVLNRLVVGIDALNENVTRGFAALSREVKAVPKKVVEGLSKDLRGVKSDIVLQLQLNANENRMLHEQLRTRTLVCGGAVMQPQGSTLHEAVSDWMDGVVMVPHHVDHGLLLCPRRDTPDGMPEGGAHEIRYPHSSPPSSVTKSLPDDTQFPM